ncbi:hypothetical protein QWZ13_14095 [Reinekea marina]|uniref:hypothetical protein n=1 Tax=Reinekea marina TaxID=1310421 RepID=UPI0025B2BCAA|nr:hypothetical protein [Reinekea marina]MDN3650047.1 hypothetical protein [Reinekea marina]
MLLKVFMRVFGWLGLLICIAAIATLVVYFRNYAHEPLFWVKNIAVVLAGSHTFWYWVIRKPASYEAPLLHEK